jgi:phage tail-like protein
MSDNRFLPAFHFRIQFNGLKNDAEADTHFQSVSGLKVMVASTDNSAAVKGNKKLPVLNNPVVLKRAISQQPISPLREWVLENLKGSTSTPLSEVLIQVLDEEHQPAITFRLTHVTAAGWQLGELNAQQSELLMEEFALQYRSVEQLNK